MKIYNVLINSNSNQVDCFSPSELKIGDTVIVAIDNYLDCGRVLKINNIDKQIKANKIIRKANNKDLKIIQNNKINEQKAFIKCRELIKKENLNMSLISSCYVFDRTQLIFKFSSDTRVDFRILAKKLANMYKTRIELRQIGVRDKAKEIGGCGQCGRELCCKKFMNDFSSVSISMAKNQGIALNPNKINGICGRLLCCLTYENDCYKDCRKSLPSLGKKVIIDNVEGKVIKIDVLKRKYFVELPDIGIKECDVDENIK